MTTPNRPPLWEAMDNGMDAQANADCGGPIGQDKGPPDGWQLEDGRMVCDSCCVTDFRILVDQWRTILTSRHHLRR